MFSISQAYRESVAHFQAGQLPQAEALCKQILSVDARNPDTLHLLGVIYNAGGQYKPAIKNLRLAVKARKDVAHFHSNLALALQNAGETGEALQNYRRALALKPDTVEAHMNMGNIFKDQGRVDDALASYNRALEYAPDNALVYYNMGQALQTAERMEEAAAAYEKAIALNPLIAEAHTNLGAIFKEQGRLNEAVALHEKAIALNPQLAEAYNNLAITFSELGRFPEAIGLQKKALALNPLMAEAYNNLGLALGEQGRFEDAAESFRHAISTGRESAGDAAAVGKQNARVNYNLGVGFKLRGELADAMVQYERAVAQDPSSVTYLSEYVHLLHHACAWERLGTHERDLLKALRKDGGGISPFIALTLKGATPADHLRAARAYAKKITLPSSMQFNHDSRRNGSGSGAGARDKIRIGYLSADLHAHPTAYLTAEMFEQHDRSRFEIIAYSYGGDDGSDMRKRLVKGFDRFHDVAQLSHQAAAQKIFDDKVDVLVDMKGYTGYARLQIPARRPAPVQVNYLGFPGSMGAPFIDYVIADSVITPMDQQPFYSEKIVQLPDSYQPNDTARRVADTPLTRAMQGLPEDGFVFCSFNNTYKITPDVFALWMRLLKAVPGSVLWLLQANSMVRENLRAAAANHGIDPERIVFAPALPLADHLARMRLADLFVDTLPVNAHTTASDALWVGLPVITCMSDAFIGRVAGSLLAATGLQDLMTHNLEDYEALALRLAQQPGELAALRQRLNDTRLQAPLFDIKRYTANIEKSYTEMWRLWQAGEEPRGFAVADLP